ncbi:probable serine/threonine-protein kinase yakA [Anastrepha obliqua]|uniref:probable serine/threonine-protein kinase yakA n=1 Tax=Anastrepha obliqua TaxID=95512 RepID=UPI002408F869|nr:probable serine/threonine-protein kinase yakA [Anastrepha obliqua]XP_054728019.1 probable serine/threonine-protein kinase yakA [Anastrepha obliqua]
MTVKLTNFFSSAASMPTTTTPPSPPMVPTAIGGSYHHHQQQPHLQYLQQQQQQTQQLQQQSSLPYNPYIGGVMDDGDLYDDDNMSLYSNATAASGIMTQRGHSCNNSQRPLLGERKPPKMLLSNNATKKNKKSTGINQPQRHLQQQQQQQQQKQGKPQQQKSYISPYVQQQKRDSAKGLHGFNDFDILSQQYTEHLRSSPHIGYPYGSPPSPTAKSNDFVFDTLALPQQQQQQQQQQHTLYDNRIYSSAGTVNQQQQQQQNSSHYQQQQMANGFNDTDYSYYGHNACIGSGSGSGSGSSNISNNGGSNALLTTTNNASPTHYMGKSSRFEDDFCSRRNATFAAPQPQPQSQSLPSSEKTWTTSVVAGSDDVGGPFIFGGMPHELFQHQHQQQQQQQPDNSTLRQEQQQQDFSSLTTAVTNSTDSVIDVADKYAPYNGHVTMSSSDTSSSSRDSSSNKGAKLLLRKGKSKRNSKDKKSDTSVVQAKVQQKQHETPSIKCVLVGDGAVGKTNLILSYLKNRFNTEHVPTASDIYNADVLVNDSPVHLTICDTAGQDTLDKLRQLCYPDSDVFLLCFSVVKPDTFHAVKTKWAPKFSKTKAALILVGTQADLRNDAQVLNKLQLNGEKPISYADAWDLAATVGAKYIETSSATQDKVKEVFDTAIWEGLAPTTLPSTPKPPLWKKLLCLA